MSRKNRNKKKRWNRRKRKLMQSSMGMSPVTTGVETKTTISSKISNQAQTVADTVSEKEKRIDPPRVQTATFPTSLNEFDEAKQREIKSHLKTVLLVSALCLILVGLLYFLELKISWIEQVLALFLL